jgi:hypothetical protein
MVPPGFRPARNFTESSSTGILVAGEFSHPPQSAEWRFQEDRPAAELDEQSNTGDLVAGEFSQPP